MIRENLAQVDVKSLRLALLLSAVVVIAAIALYLVKPQVKNFNDSQNVFDMLSNQIDDQQQLQQTIDAEHKQIKQLQLQLHGEAGDMPVNEIEAYLVGRLQGLAWDAGIELVSVRPGFAKTIMEFEEISFEVEVAGEYVNLFRWLNKMSDTLGFMLVSSYKINPIGRQSDDLKLKMNVTIVFYRVADK